MLSKRSRKRKHWDRHWSLQPYYSFCLMTKLRNTGLGMLSEEYMGKYKTIHNFCNLKSIAFFIGHRALQCLKIEWQNSRASSKDDDDVACACVEDGGCFRVLMTSRSGPGQHTRILGTPHKKGWWPSDKLTPGKGIPPIKGAHRVTFSLLSLKLFTVKVKFHFSKCELWSSCIPSICAIH